VKGRLRAECYEYFWKKIYPEKKQDFLKNLLDKNMQEGLNLSTEEMQQQAEKAVTPKSYGLEAAFGPDTTHAEEHAGAVSVGDARILLFPVRSLAGVFVWTTSVEALCRFLRTAALTGEKMAGDKIKIKSGDGSAEKEVEIKLPEPPPNEQALIASPDVVAGDKVVLEEFSFTPDNKQQEHVKAIATWLAQRALPQDAVYEYWKKALPNRLVILPDELFSDFTQFATEVVTRIKINSETKTVDSKTGALWTEESLPTDTLLYAPLMATAPRTTNNGALPNDKRTAKDMLLLVEKSLPAFHIQLGGDETVGRGTVCLRFSDPRLFTNANAKGGN
jgi:CRISPR-associated protein Cmr4